VFESFNAVFRKCSVLSNHQAPSRDIALQFGKQEGFKHRATGGWWKTENGDWVQVGPGVKRSVTNNPEILENVGLSSDTPDVPAHLGSIKLVARGSKQRQRLQVSWKSTKASQAINATSLLDVQNQPLFPVQYLVARSSDRCEIDSWVVANSPQFVCTCSASVVCHTHRL